MSERRNLLTLGRLIAIKKEALELHRVDLTRLKKLLEVERSRLEKLIVQESSHVDEMRRSQANSRMLDAMEMIRARQYLGGVREKIILQTRVCEDIEGQTFKVQAELERAYLEMRALEQLSERKQLREDDREKRAAYLHADDQEITRVMNEKVLYVGN